jgi:hypothetical protein
MSTGEQEETGAENRERILVASSRKVIAPLYCAARIICHREFYCITPTLIKLHWLLR